MAKLLILCNYFLAQTPGSLTTQLCIPYCSNHAGIARKDVRDGRQRGADDKAPRQQVKQPQPCPISQLHAHRGITQQCPGFSAAAPRGLGASRQQAACSPCLHAHAQAIRCLELMRRWQMMRRKCSPSCLWTFLLASLLCP